MEETNEKKQRRPRRTKTAIEESIRNAAEKEILENGFSDSLVSNILKKAKIEARVFYLRYKDLNEFYDEFVKNYDYWFTDLFKEEKINEVSAEGLETIFKKLLSSLNDSSVMLELLRWEVSRSNPTTERTAMLRELYTQKLTNSYEYAFKHSNIDVVAICSLIIAGIYYLTLHKDRSPFCGIDLNKDSDKVRMAECLSWIADRLFIIKKEQDNRRIISEKLRQKGVSEDIISECVMS
ncbi:MAG: TetR/AcrR family transcriptional regulator [Muribaculum sp.]|nr:TetR/AcrR family transcriptional regulator [Muribaculum sp.]